MPNLMIVRNEYPDEGALERVLDYALDTPLQGGYGVDPEYAFVQMKLVKRAYDKTTGVQLKHFVVSFSHEEMVYLDFDDLLNLGFGIGAIFEKYQLVYGIHLDTEHVHMHFVMNTVSFLDGQKYADGSHGFYRVCNFLRMRYPKFSVDLYTSESRYGKKNAEQ